MTDKNNDHTKNDSKDSWRMEHACNHLIEEKCSTFEDIPSLLPVPIVGEPWKPSTVDSNFINPLGLNNQQDIDMLSTYYGLLFRSRRPLTRKEATEGRLAVALRVCDGLLECCKKGQCVDVKNVWIPLLDDLSFDTCIRMKAYLIWEAKGKPIQNAFGRDDDYIAALRNVWAIPSCKGNNDLAKQIKPSFPEEMKEALANKKAYWRWMAKKGESHDRHASEARLYLDHFYATLRDEPLRQSLDELVSSYGPMMSVLEFLILRCKIITS